MAESEDHREKNILLAKNLNEVKMDLRCKKQDIVLLQTQLRREQQRNSQLESDQVALVNRIDTLKKQLDDTFINNAVSYLNLSKQLDQMHQDSIQSIGDNSLLSPSATSNSTRALFLEKIKMFSESLTSHDEEVNMSTLNDSQHTNNRNSLSFNSIEIGLNSTFVKDADDEPDDSKFNTTFTTEELENSIEVILTPPPLQKQEMRSLLCSEARNYNITKRRAKAIEETPKVKTKAIHRRSRGHKENRSDNSSLLKKMVLRQAKRIDYNETSFRRTKQTTKEIKS